MIYLTRNMIAQREFAHGDKYMHKGDTFAATPVDADYYVKVQFAVEAGEPSKAPAVGTVVDEPVVALAVADEAVDDSAGDEAEADSAQPGDAPAVKKRGRPSNASKAAE